MKRLLSGVVRRLGRLMLVVNVLHAVAYARFLYFHYLLRRLDIHQNVAEGVAKNTVMHNRRAMRRSVTRVARSNVLIRPLSVVHRVQSDLLGKDILSIGPRSEAELLSLMAHGFRWNRIRGVDLISYSPRIDTGDMHKLQYADDSFDIVMASRVLGYSNDPRRAASEMLRVVRDGGLIAINTGDLQPGDSLDKYADYLTGSDTLFSRLDELLGLYAPHVDQVYFRNDPAGERGQSKGPLLAIFSVDKNKRSG